MYKYTRQNRLTKAEDFSRVFSRNKRKYLKGITLLASPNQLKQPRLGFAISKKQINKASQRNRIKRIAKEVFRKQKNRLSNIDIIILVKKECQYHPNLDLSEYFSQLFTQLTK